MSYGSMHIKIVNQPQEFQDIEVLFGWERGIILILWGHSGVFFIDMETPGKCCWDVYCIGVGKVQAKQKRTNLNLSDAVWLS